MNGDDAQRERDRLLDRVMAGEIDRATYHRLLAALNRPGGAGHGPSAGDRPTGRPVVGSGPEPVSAGDRPTRAAFGPASPRVPAEPPSQGDRPTRGPVPGGAPALPRSASVPATAADLLALVQKSELVEEARLARYVQDLTARSGVPDDPLKLARLLVRDAVLTYFQAEQLLQGKYKRFHIGRYKVLEKLGSGGMGSVFLCEHTRMRRLVALKVLPVASAESGSGLEMFYREARAVAALDHPNIIRAYDIDRDDNLHYIVMEWVDGCSLYTVAAHGGVLDVTRAAHYIAQAASALQYAHEVGIVHRDIKPGNILLDRSGVVKVADYGLARLNRDAEDILARYHDENVLGTVDYLSPEQAMDSHTVDIRGDIYSLGATFYFLLTGSPLFPAGSAAQKLIWHQNRGPRPVKSLRPDAPAALLPILDRMLAKDPSDRYQLPAEIVEALSPWTGTPIPPPPEDEMPLLSPAVVDRYGP